jgi:toxin CcdB
MPQFAVHRDRQRPKGALLLDVQSDLIADLGTRIVVPLVPGEQRRIKPVEILMPEFKIEGKRYLMLTPQLAGIPAADLGEQVFSLRDHRDSIVKAIDLLITGI